jgi:DNA-binding PadR family transcriptional regulator
MSKGMQEPTFLILAALAAGPQHGYGIMNEAEHLSGGERRLQAGTLYAALDRLTGEGLVAADREEVVDARFRRYYRLTDDGARALTAETARRQAQTRAVTQRLRAAGLATRATLAISATLATRAAEALTRPATPGTAIEGLS